MGMVWKYSTFDLSDRYKHLNFPPIDGSISRQIDVETSALYILFTAKYYQQNKSLSLAQVQRHVESSRKLTQRQDSCEHYLTNAEKILSFGGRSVRIMYILNFESQ